MKPLSPVLGLVAALAFGGTAWADLLPVKQGRYAPVGVSCAAEGVLTYDGYTLGAGEVRACQATASRAGSSTYRVTETCAGETGPRVQETLYRVTGRSAFSVLDASGRAAAAYRLCALQAQPELLRGWLP